jgi:hypothetical protein
MQQVKYNTTTQNVGQYRIIVNRSDKTGVFSGDFNHGSKQSDSAKATLNRTFTGVDVGVEVFSVASQQLSPAELCASLKQSNDGEPAPHVLGISLLAIYCSLCCLCLGRFGGYLTLLQIQQILKIVCTANHTLSIHYARR